MAAPTDNTMLDTWKRQLDAAMRLTEVVIEGTERMREVQIEAAADAHADAVATQKSLAAATNPAELMRIQAEWLAANQRKSLEYWKCLFECAAETNAQVMRCLGESAPKGE
jgi:phasin family protein